MGVVEAWEGEWDGVDEVEDTEPRIPVKEAESQDESIATAKAPCTRVQLCRRK